MRFSFTVLITLLFTVFGFCSTSIHADEFPGQLQDISDTITMTDTGNRIVSRSLPMDYSGDSSRSGAFIKVIGGSGDDFCFSIDLTADGGYILTGQAQRELLLMKLDANGNKIWMKTYVWDTSYDVWHMRGQYVRQVSDGGYIVVGNVTVEALGNEYHYGVVLKITSAGWVSWAKISENEEYFNSIEQASGGYIIAGYKQQYSDPYLYHSQYLIKINYDGDVIFKRIIDDNENDASDSYLYNVQQCIDYGYIACGSAEPDREVWVRKQCLQKFDASGNVSWIKYVNGFNAYYSELHSARQTSDFCYIAAGVNIYSGNQQKASFIKVNSDGTKMWARDVSGVIDDEACMYSVEETVSGDIIAVGYTGDSSDRAGYFLKLSSTGTLIAARIIDGTSNDSLRSIRETADSGYIMTGKTGGVYSDILLIKTSSSGLVPGCSILEACSPASTEPFTEIDPMTYDYYVDSSELGSVGITITERNLGITTLCLEPTVTPTATSTPTNTPTPTITPTPTPTATAVGCSILCFSSDEDNSIPHVEPALVSTGLLSPPDIFHIVVGKNPPDLVDLMPYDAILFWSFEELGDKVGLGDVLKDYVDAGGGVVLATYAFTSDIGMGNIQIAGGILDPGYSPFLPESSQQVAGQMDAGSADPNHAYFDGVDLENIIYFKSEQFSNPPLNEGGNLLARDQADLNFLAENNDGTVGAVSMFPGEMNHPSTTDDARRLVANMLMTVSGCNAEPTVTPTPSPTAPPTDTPIPTDTPVPPTDTPVPTDSPTPSVTAEPTGTPTEIPTDTPTEIPTETPTSIPTDTPVPTMTSTPSPTCIHHGDVTGDGGVTAADAQLAFEIVMELHEPSLVEECAADCNGDGNVTAGDAQQIFGVIFGGSCMDPLV